MRFTVSEILRANCSKTPERSEWIARLHGTVSDLALKWNIEVGEPFDTDEATASWVAPVKRSDGTRAVLKIGMPHMEAEHEIAGLRFWDGDPTVRLIEFDEDLGAMLLERCQPGVVLRGLPEPEQDVVIAGLLRRLWRAPSSPHPFRPLSALMSHWSAETLASVDRWPDRYIDPGLVRSGLALFDDLARTASLEFLLATDLHAGNVLSAQREPWLVIDPKPFIGDQAYDATQHLLNCSERLRSKPHDTIKRFADLLGADPERVRLWTFARATAEPRDDWADETLPALARVLAP